MFFSDSQTAQKLGAAESGNAHDAEWWSGEPPTVVGNLDSKSLFESIAKEIANADVLLVKDREWIVEGDFAGHMNTLFSHYVNQGGNIEYPGLASNSEAP